MSAKSLPAASYVDTVCNHRPIRSHCPSTSHASPYVLYVLCANSNGTRSSRESIELTPPASRAVLQEWNLTDSRLETLVGSIDCIASNSAGWRVESVFPIAQAQQLFQ